MSLSSSPERARGQRELWSSLPFPTTPRPPAPSPSYPLLEAPGNPSLSSFSPSSRRHFPSPSSSVNTVSSSPAPRCLRPPRAAPLPPRAPPLSPCSPRTLNRAGDALNHPQHCCSSSSAAGVLPRFRPTSASSGQTEPSYVFLVPLRTSWTPRFPFPSSGSLFSSLCHLVPRRSSPPASLRPPPGDGAAFP
jgi:hypothetical protein